MRSIGLELCIYCVRSGLGFGSTPIQHNVGSGWDFRARARAQVRANCQVHKTLTQPQQELDWSGSGRAQPKLYH